METRQQKWIKKYPLTYKLFCYTVDGVIFFIKVYVCIEILKILGGKV